jgi:phage major head subunit gpT-like protein
MPLDAPLCRAFGRPATLSIPSRSVEAVALSGPAPAVRPPPAPNGTRGAWVEELDPTGADLAVFDGIPALQDHTNRVSAAVGVVERAHLERGQIVCLVRFDKSPEADALMDKLEAGSVRGVSLGYTVQEWTRAGTRDGLPVYRATRWTPRELSFTPLPVDAGALIRKDTTMAEQATAPADAPETETSTSTDDRVAALETKVDGLADTLGEIKAAVTRGTNDNARAAAPGTMTTRSQVIDNRPARVEGGADYTDPTVIRRAMSDALAAQFCDAVKVEGMATRFRSYRPSGMVAALASARGERVDPYHPEAIMDGIFTRAHSTSDFPLLLADAANKSLLTQYQAAAPTYRQIAARKSFADFKAHKFLRVGDFPDFEEIAEGGPARYGTLSENQETVTAKELGTAITIGRRVLVNDDLSALADFSSLIATRAAAKEESLVYALLASDGPTMTDGASMFSTASTRGNKASAGAAISSTSIGAAVAALRKMTGLDGLPLNIQPRFLVVGPDKELQARQVLATINPTEAENVNPWSSVLTLVVSTHVSGNRWFVAADPGQVPCLVYGYVQGMEGPQIHTEIDFDTRGVRVRAGLDFGCGVIDWRGWHLNTGA